MPTPLRKIQPRSSFDERDSTLFARIAADLTDRGFSINPAAVPSELVDPLFDHVVTMEEEKFAAAGIGRGRKFTRSKFVRTDEIAWIEGSSRAGQNWLDWTASLQRYLNRHLLLGLFSFESHFSRYGAGDYYKRHKDAFKGEANRVLSLVLYLNPGWTPADGGELVIYPADGETSPPSDAASTAMASGVSERAESGLAVPSDEGIKVTPLMGTLVLFLSEDFPHEVLPANRDRYAIAGWYRVNTSVTDRVDPPR